MLIHNGDIIRYTSGVYGMVIKCEDDFYHVITEKSEVDIWAARLCKIISFGDVKMWNALDSIIYGLKAEKERQEKLEKEGYK